MFALVVAGLVLILAAVDVLGVVVSARPAPLVAVGFASGAVVLLLAVILGSKWILVIGLMLSVAAPIGYGHVVLGRNQVMHHVTRAALCGAILVGWLTTR